MGENTVRIKPFDGSTDFSMWQLKMRAILTKKKCLKAITEEWADETSEATKKELQEQAHAEIIIRLADEVARQVVTISKPKDLWDALTAKYMTKSLPSTITLLSALFNFKMNTSVTLEDNLDKFLRLTQDLERCGDSIKDKHQATILLNALPAQFDTFKDVIQFSRDDLTKDKVTESIS